MKNLSGLIDELRTLAEQADETASALERLQALQNIEPKWTLNVEETASALDVNISTVYEYCRQGQIPCVRLGKRIIIPRLALLKWLEKNARAG